MKNCVAFHLLRCTYIADEKTRSFYLDNGINSYCNAQHKINCLGQCVTDLDHRWLTVCESANKTGWCTWYINQTANINFGLLPGQALCPPHVMIVSSFRCKKE